MERLSSWLGFIFTAELPRGRDLLARVRGRCDLVLHGHRHVPRGARLFGPPRPMHVFNAGSSTELARVRVFAHNGAGPPAGRAAVAGRSGALGGRRSGVRRRGEEAPAERLARRAGGGASASFRPTAPGARLIRSRLPDSTTRRFERHSIEWLTRP